jgi:hypothetical protein
MAAFFVWLGGGGGGGGGGAAGGWRWRRRPFVP